MKKLLTLFLFLVLLQPSGAQTNEWLNYTSGGNISCLTEEGDYLWLGTFFAGLVKLEKTTGNITVFNKVNSGLPDNSVSAIAIDVNGNIWIGTFLGGLSVYNKGGVVSVEESRDNSAVSEYSLLQNYPNPFNPSTTIVYTIKKETHVSLKVYDLLGREVSELVNENQVTGKYKVKFDVSNLPSGVYLYTLKAGNFVETKKLMVLK